jgi:hypothetical protein
LYELIDTVRASSDEIRNVVASKDRSWPRKRDHLKPCPEDASKVVDKSLLRGPIALRDHDDTSVLLEMPSPLMSEINAWRSNDWNVIVACITNYLFEDEGIRLTFADKGRSRIISE